MAHLDKTARFNQVALQHLDAAYNLARWLTQHPQDAEDVVQESYLKAFRHFDSFRGGDGRAWLLAIIRNTSYTRIQMNKKSQMDVFDEAIHHDQFNHAAETNGTHRNPEQLVFQALDRELIDAAIKTLPVEFREVIVLRELEDFSYHEIAGIVGIPVGTVMSRLARARGMLRNQLAQHFKPESSQ